MEREIIPAKYHLATNDNGIEIAINKSVVPIVEDFPLRFIDSIRSSLRLPYEFIPPSNDREWGFGSVLKQVDSPNKDWLIYSAPFPRGISSVDDNRGYAYSATLGLLLDSLNRTNKLNTSPTPQFTEVSLSSRRGSELEPWETNSIHATLHPPLLEWLEQHSEVDMQPAIEQAMRQAHGIMSGERIETYDWAIQFSKTDPNSVYFDVPGNATTLSSYIEKKHDPVPEGTGDIHSRYKLRIKHRLVPHNTDRVESQVILLAGVAKLEELATGGFFRNPQN